MTIYEHDGKILETGNFQTTKTKIERALKSHINNVQPVYKLFCEMQQSKQQFREWHPKLLDQARICIFEGYTAERAVRNTIVMPTSNHKPQKALAEGNEK